MRFRTIAMVAVLQIACATGLTADARTVAPGDVLIQAQFDTALMGARENDQALVKMALGPAMTDAIFSQLSREKRQQVATLYAMAAHHEGDWSAAHHAYVLAITEGVGGAEIWDGRLHTAILAGDGADAYLAFRHLRDAGTPVLSTFAGGQIDRLDQLLRDLPDGAQARIALGREMAREDWSPPYIFDDPSNLWLHYVEALLDAGDLKAANAAAGRITNPMIMMAMHADRRFDGVIAANPGLQDPEAAAEHYLAWARAYAEAQPRLLMAKLAVVRALTILNRPAEALPIVEDAGRAMASAPRGRPPFDDMEMRYAMEAWRSSLLLQVGRIEEGLAARTAALSCGCSPDAVSYLAHAFMEAGRPQDAARWLREAPTAGLGLQEQMRLTETRVCVAAQLGDREELERGLKSLSDHEAWKPEALVGALVCADRSDDAEAVLVRQLSDPRLRLSALSQLQSYGVNPQEAPFTKVLDARWAALRSRPSLKAEAAKVGRLKRFDLLQWESVS